MFLAEVITILPAELDNGDFVITKKQLENEGKVILYRNELKIMPNI